MIVRYPLRSVWAWRHDLPKKSHPHRPWTATLNFAYARLVALAPGLCPERRLAPLARGLEIHACMQNPSPHISKMQLYFRNMKYSQDCRHSCTPTRQFLIMRFIFFLNNCENNERITIFNEKILDFLNICGLYVIMRSVNFGTVWSMKYLSFIYPERGGFGEIFPEVMIFPEGFSPRKISSLNEIFHRIPRAEGL